MSLGNPAVECFSIYEPRMNLSNVAQRQYAIVRGGNTITPYKYPATSYSNNSVQFTCTPPSRSTVLDRIAIVKFPVQLEFVGLVPNTGLLLNKQGDAFRAWPISSCTNSLVAQINGYGVSIEMSKIIHALTRFNQPHDLRNTFLSLTTQMDDNCQDYRCMLPNNQNPLGLFGDVDKYPARGAYPMTISQTAGDGATSPSTATVTANLYEYVVLPPFIYDGNESGGLTHLDTLTFTYSFGDLRRMWSHCSTSTGGSNAETNPITQLNISLSQPEMNLFYLTPRLTDYVPSTLVYPYYQITNYITQNNSQYQFNDSFKMVSNVIQLQSIPNKIICYVKQSNSVITQDLRYLISLTDSFAQITSCSINWNNINGIYSNSDQIHLWSTAIQNGLTMSYEEWNGSLNSFNTDQNGKNIALTGSILCFEPGKDLPLRDDEAPGMLGQYNLQISLDCVNINPYSTVNYPASVAYTEANVKMQPELNIVCIYEGILTIQDNSTLAQIGVVSKQDALTAPIRYDYCFSAMEAMYGGNFFTKVRDWVKNKAIPWVKEHGPQIASVARAVAPLVGLGEGEGGARLNRQQLKSRLRRI
jgi:hypothetical protein